MANWFVPDFFGSTQPRVFTIELFPSQTPLTSTSISRYSQPRGSGNPCANKVSAAETMLVGMLVSARHDLCCCGGSGNCSSARQGLTIVRLKRKLAATIFMDDFILTA